MKEIMITTAFIALDQLLKYAGLVASGGEAKEWIRGGDIWVNGESCTVVRKKLYPGDRVDVPDAGTFLIVAAHEN